MITTINEWRKLNRGAKANESSDRDTDAAVNANELSIELRADIQLDLPQGWVFVGAKTVNGTTTWKSTGPDGKQSAVGNNPAEMIRMAKDMSRTNEASQATWENELNAEQAAMWNAIKPALGKTASDPDLEVEHTEDFGVEPNQIQLDMTLEGDDEDEYDVVSVLVTKTGDTYKVEQWTQMFAGNGGEDTNTVTTVGLSIKDCAKLVAKYIK